MREAPYGYCHCGCGKRTSLASQNDTKRGYLKGEPYRFARGHGLAKGKTVKWLEEDHGYRTPCWIWQLAIGWGGYGLSKNGPRLAHRNVWEQHNGPVPEGLVLDHLCRVHACVRPDHLEPVTHPENCRRGDGTKLTHMQVADIRSLLADGWRQRDIAVAFGTSQQNVSNIKRGKSWQ